MSTDAGSRKSRFLSTDKRFSSGGQRISSFLSTGRRSGSGVQRISFQPSDRRSGSVAQRKSFQPSDWRSGSIAQRKSSLAEKKSISGVRKTTRFAVRKSFDGAEPGKQCSKTYDKVLREELACVSEQRIFQEILPGERSDHAIIGPVASETTSKNAMKRQSRSCSSGTSDGSREDSSSSSEESIEIEEEIEVEEEVSEEEEIDEEDWLEEHDEEEEEEGKKEGEEDEGEREEGEDEIEVKEEAAEDEEKEAFEMEEVHEEGEDEHLEEIEEEFEKIEETLEEQSKHEDSVLDMVAADATLEGEVMEHEEREEKKEITEDLAQEEKPKKVKRKKKIMVKKIVKRRVKRKKGKRKHGEEGAEEETAKDKRHVKHVPRDGQKHPGVPDFDPAEQERLCNILKGKMVELANVRRKNKYLMKVLVNYFQKKKMEFAYIEESASEELTIKYLKKLKLYEEMKQMAGNDRQQRENEVTAMRKELEDVNSKYKQELNDFHEKQIEIGKCLVDTRTGKPFSDPIVNQLISRYMNNINRVSATRLELVKLHNHVARKEAKLKRLDKIADGTLNLLEYEQLKLDNQIFAEKLEEREEELSGFRNKTANAIHMTAHIRSRSDAALNDYEIYSGELRNIKRYVTEMREKVNGVKQERDHIRDETIKLKQSAGLLIRPRLINDLEICCEKISAGIIKLDELQQKFQEQREIIKRLRSSLLFAEREAANLKRPSLF